MIQRNNLHRLLLRRDLTLNTRESSITGTDKAVGSIDTGSSVLTWIGSAFVDRRLTDDAAESDDADTSETVDAVFTHGAILTRIGRTLVDVGLTQQTGITGQTVTLCVVVVLSGARRAILTRIGGTKCRRTGLKYRVRWIADDIKVDSVA
jgi:hypothetical protein